MTARQSPALDTTRLPFLINAVTQQEPPWRSFFRKSESVLRYPRLTASSTSFSSLTITSSKIFFSKLFAANSAAFAPPCPSNMPKKACQDHKTKSLVRLNSTHSKYNHHHEHVNQSSINLTLTIIFSPVKELLNFKTSNSRLYLFITFTNFQ